MNKVLLILLVTVTFLQFCTSSKKLNAAHVPVTWSANVQPVIVANCSPCHFPPKGFKKPLDTYDAAKNNIDDILHRINLNPGDRGFMPFKHQKMSDSLIAVVTQWQKDGLIEK